MCFSNVMLAGPEESSVHDSFQHAIMSGIITVTCKGGGGGGSGALH